MHSILLSPLRIINANYRGDTGHCLSWHPYSITQKGTNNAGTLAVYFMTEMGAIEAAAFGDEIDISSVALYEA